MKNAPPIDTEPLTRLVKVSAACLRQMLHACDDDYVRDVCHGACCNCGDGIVVTVHPSEQAHIEELGATVVTGMVVADDRGRCPFSEDPGRCGVHFKGKPFGCATGPYTLNSKDTLIVRNRYRQLICFKAEGAMPAYKSHRFALDQLFGEDEAQVIVDHLEAGGGDLWAKLSLRSYHMLKDNDVSKKKFIAAREQKPDLLPILDQATA